MSKGGAKAKGILVCARVRPLMPFEEGEKNCIEECEKPPKIVLNLATGQQLEYPFTKVVGRTRNNLQTFKDLIFPLVKSCLDGYNCIVIAYGQTGCGKTYTMIGKPHHNPPVLGLVPLTIEALLATTPQPNLSISVCDAYGTATNKITIYDLFSPKNHEEVTGSHEEFDEERWTKMSGKVNFDMKGITKIKFDSVEEGCDLVIEGNSRNHFAATGKNPDSSRGHTVLLINVKPQQNAETIIDESRFIFNDCAGSEGDTALTPKYVSSHSPETVLKRKLEGSVINTGLLQLKRIFKDLREKSKLLSNDKTGLKRILFPFVNAESEMCILFMMSPAKSNSTATNATLKFAQEAAAIKVKPIKKEAKKNWQLLAQELEKKIAQLSADGGEGMGMGGPLMLPKQMKGFSTSAGKEESDEEYKGEDGGKENRGRQKKRRKRGGSSDSSDEAETKQRRKESENVREWELLQKLLLKKNNEENWFSRKELIYISNRLDIDLEIIEEDAESIKLEEQAVVEHMTNYIRTLKKQLEEMIKKQNQKNKGKGKGGLKGPSKIEKMKAKAKDKKKKRNKRR